MGQGRNTMNRSPVVLLAAATLVAAAGFSTATATNAGLYASGQAAAGAKLYAASCARCHGADLEGVSGPALKGADLTAPGAQGKLTVGDIFKYMVNLMPAGNPGSLTHDQYVDVMAYLLRENGHPAGSRPLSYDVASHSNDPIGQK
jgi:mono/diheme cytochrome c family protein